jgi:hypothetical protein
MSHSKLYPSAHRLFKDPSCILLPPRSRTRPPNHLITTIAATLATRFDRDVRTVRISLSFAEIEEWGKVRRVDSDAGDTMHASTLVPARDDTRDATYVRVRVIPLFTHSSAESCSMRC